MELDRLQRNWERLGNKDPLFAILDWRRGAGNEAEFELFFQDGENFIAWVADFLGQRGIAVNPGRVLDFGCGYGRLSQALARRFQSVVGVDIAESMLAGARQHNRHGDRVTYVLNKTADLRQFKDASFDAVMTILVLQHMRKNYQTAYLREFLRVLRPGGVAFFQTPREPLHANVNFPEGKEQPDEAVIQIHHMKVSEVAATVESAGGEILVVESDGWAGYDYASAHYVVRRKP